MIDGVAFGLCCLLHSIYYLRFGIIFCMATLLWAIKMSALALELMAYQRNLEKYCSFET